jgi:hypothetical protein
MRSNPPPRSSSGPTTRDGTNSGLNPVLASLVVNGTPFGLPLTVVPGPVVLVAATMAAALVVVPWPAFRGVVEPPGPPPTSVDVPVPVPVPVLGPGPGPPFVLVAVVVGVAVEVPVGVVRRQAGVVKTSVSRVTEPMRARARPWTVTPVVTDIDVCARIVPTKLEFVPNVAELPICQKTLHGWAPLIMLTLLDEAVVSVEPIWNMNTAVGSPWASNVNVPVRPAELDAV